MNITIYKLLDKPCKWCDKAVTLVSSLGHRHTVVALDKADLLVVADRAGMNTVPIIYCEDGLVGGYAELEAFLNKDF